MNDLFKMRVFVSCLLILGVGLAAAQECKPEDKIPYETPIQAEELTPLLQLTVPETCGDFQIAELLVCQEDANIKEGCCDQLCQDLFAKVDNQCLSDIAGLVCAEGFLDVIPLVDNLARRCDDQYVKLECPAEGGTVELSAAANATDTAPAAEAPLEETLEECTPPVPTDEPVNTTVLLPLATLSVPDTCAEFSATSLIVCQEELNYKEGCCAQQCKDVFAQVSQTCVADLGHLICTAETGAEAFPIIQTLARRCDENFVELSCEQLAERDAALSSPDPEDPFNLLDEDETVAGDLDEEVAEPADFFEDPNPTVPAAEEEEASTGIPSVEGASDDEYGFFGSEPLATPSADIAVADPTTIPDSSGEVVATDPESSTSAVDDDCTPPVPVDTPVNTTLLLPLATIVAPESCGDFNAAALINCQEELNYKEGCCAQQCKDVFGGISQDCVSDLGHLICLAETGAEAFPIIQRLARRCDEEYIDLSCEQLAERAGDSPAQTSDIDDNTDPEDPEDQEDQPTEPDADSDDCEVVEEVDSSVDVSAISSHLALVDQTTCPLLNTTDIFNCQKDITLKSGCCQPECKSLLAKMEDECLEEISRTICGSSSDEFFIFDRMAKRCIDGYESQTCTSLIENGAGRPSFFGTILGVTLLVLMIFF